VEEKSVRGKKTTLVMLASAFLFLLAKPELHMHLVSWRVVICTPSPLLSMWCFVGELSCLLLFQFLNSPEVSFGTGKLTSTPVTSLPSSCATVTSGSVSVRYVHLVSITLVLQIISTEAFLQSMEWFV
jgi:hypothetical protein